MDDHDLGLDGPFSVLEGRAAGLSDDDLRPPRWHSDFAGVRSYDEARTPVELARAYAVKMRSSAYFSHVTAAVVHGLALPLGLERRMLLDVSVPPGVRAPRDRRVKGHHLIERPGLVRTKHGLRVASVLETVCQLAAILGLEDFIAAAESAMAKDRPDRVALGMLVAAVRSSRRPHQHLLERALPELREGTRSARETALRRLLTRNGLPEPEINAHIRDEFGGWLAERDLVYRLQKVIVEYDGEAHFTQGRQRRDDLARDRRLTALGWIVIRVSKDDLADRPDEIVAQVRAALAARG